MGERFWGSGGEDFQLKEGGTYFQASGGIVGTAVSKRLLSAFRAKNDSLILSTFQWWKILHSFLHGMFEAFKWVDGEKH